jgi:ribulose-phosphate 3-epimerase
MAPSILTADFARLGEQVAEAEQGGADCLHLDVMDGVFVPNMSFGPMVVKSLRAVTRLPLHTHLMIVHPEKWIDAFADAGSDSLTVHVEACPDLEKTLGRIEAAGMRVGVTLNPETPLSAVEAVLPQVDELLVMLVEPGYGGQAMIPAMLDRVRQARRLLDARGLEVELAADGGIKAENVAEVVRSGATLVVAGSAVFNKKEPVVGALGRLRASIEGAQV